MSLGYQFSDPLPISGRGFVWLPYSGESLISPERFALEVWHRIVSDIDSDEQWREFLVRYRHVCSCYVLYPNDMTEPIAMCYILGEHAMYDDAAPGTVVSAHGGGWRTDLGSKLLHARAWVAMVRHLASLGCTVLTSVKDDNLPARHLVTKTGFALNDIGMYEYDPASDAIFAD